MLQGMGEKVVCLEPDDINEEPLNHSSQVSGHLLLSCETDNKHSSSVSFIDDVWKIVIILQSINRRIIEDSCHFTAVTLIIGRDGYDAGHPGSFATLYEGLFFGLLRGLVPTLNREWGHIPLNLVVLGNQPQDEPRLVDVLADVTREVIVLDHSRVWIPALVKVDKVMPDEGTQGGVLLIAGAFGGVGCHLVPWAINKGYHRIILLSRNTLETEERQSLLRKWQQQTGKETELVPLQADVNDDDLPDKIAAACDDLSLELIIHAAGEIHDALFVNQSHKEWQQIMGGKLLGALGLGRIAKSYKSCRLLLFSSVTSLVGNVGAAAYGAANGALDALAIYLHRQGFPACSIGWGIWQDTGMARHLAGEVSGILPATPESLLAVLDNFRGLTEPNLVIARFSLSPEEDRTSRLLPWKCPAHVHRSGGAFPAHGCLIQEASTSKPLQPANDTFLTVLAELPASQQTTKFKDWLLAHAESVLGFERGTLCEHDGLFDKGMTSLTAVEFSKIINRQLGIELPVSRIVGIRNTQKLASYLLPIVQKVLAENNLNLGRGSDSAEAPVFDKNGQTTVEKSIAITGASCVLPGNIRTLDDLWDLLSEGQCAVTDIPEDRWDGARHYDPSGQKQGFSWCCRGAFIDAAEWFDARFFGISTREAEKMDPMQRLLLEHCWHALESAGIGPDQVSDTRTGIYVGIGSSDYHERLGEQADVPDAYDLTGIIPVFPQADCHGIWGCRGQVSPLTQPALLLWWLCISLFRLCALVSAI